MTADLAAWLVADDGPIATDEARARAAQPGPWDVFDSDMPGEHTVRHRNPNGTPDPHRVATTTGLHCAALDAEHIATWDPDRVLAECAAKRQIIEATWGGPDHEQMWEHAVRALAQPYAGRPGWRDEWRN